MRTHWLGALLGGLMFWQSAAAAEVAGSAYDFSFETIDGAAMPLADFKGKTLLVVNTASECGFTGQYADLQKLWETYKDRGLVVIGVPSNDFGGQEPGSNEQIKKFCQSKFAITFPLTAKVSVTGDAAHPFYKWANATLQTKPKWNFHKYLVGPDGQLKEWFSAITEPDSGALIRAVEASLAGNN